MRVRNLALLTCFGLVYIFYSTLQRRGRPPAWPDSETAFAEDFEEVQSLKKVLSTLEDAPPRISNLRGEAYHASIIGRFAAAYAKSPSLSLWQELNDLVSLRYPWWLQNSTSYVPWRAPIYQIQGIPTSTGIVVWVGQENFMFAAHLISLLRKIHRSTLPIEIAYSGENALPKRHRDALAGLGQDVSFNNLLFHFDDTIVGLKGSGHSMKSFAIVASRFSNVILVDADIVFLQSPDSILERSTQFRTTGTLFYHNRAYRGPQNIRKAWLAETFFRLKKCSAELERSLFWKEDLWGQMDSGVMAINKSKQQLFLSMLFAARINSKGVRDIVYQRLGSDKETYWLATEMTDTPYAFQPKYAGSIGQPTGAIHDRKQCSTHAAHLDESGRKLFWFSGALTKNKALKTEVSSNALANFGHHVAAGKSMDEQPRWMYRGEGVWCAEGKPMIPLHSQGLDQTVSLMLEEAMTVEKELKDFK
ncbi:MAG: hypothetical protein Q9227_004956 [Pyrenula ochraceoflavens]